MVNNLNRAIRKYRLSNVERLRLLGTSDFFDRDFEYKNEKDSQDGYYVLSKSKHLEISQHFPFFASETSFTDGFIQTFICFAGGLVDCYIEWKQSSLSEKPKLLEEVVIERFVINDISSNFSSMYSRDRYADEWNNLSGTATPAEGGIVSGRAHSIVLTPNAMTLFQSAVKEYVPRSERTYGFSNYLVNQYQSYVEERKPVVTRDFSQEGSGFPRR